MFNIFSSSKTIHTCKISGFELSQSSKFGASISLTEDDGINHVPNNFQCTLPDGSSWTVKGGTWTQVGKAKKGGTESW